jgi:hypothetical protein
LDTAAQSVLVDWFAARLAWDGFGVAAFPVVAGVAAGGVVAFFGAASEAVQVGLGFAGLGQALFFVVADGLPEVVACFVVEAH